MVDPLRARPRTPAGPGSLFLRGLGVFLLAALVWVLHSGRLSLEAWSQPTAYSGDALEVLARMKASAEGDLVPFTAQRVERLGAPFAADWSAYPMPERLQIFVLGQLARVTGVPFASNFGLMVSFAFSAAVFFWAVRRWLQVATPWAVLGALLFAFNASVVQRGLPHFSFVITWVVPLGLVACWLVARAAPVRRWSAEFWWCVAAGAALGAHNTYYLFFWLQLIGWAAIVQWFRARRLENIVTAGAAVAAALAVFCLVNIDYWLADPADQAMPLLQRNYGGTERYALKPLELMIPPAQHRVDLLAFLGQRYGRWSEWRGETMHPYLGLIGIGALVWLAAASLPRLLRGRRVPGQALAVGWLTAFATVGGVTNMLAFFTGLFLFRATNRIGVFIAAVLLVFLVLRLSRATASWPRWRRWLAAAGLTVIGLLDQLPRADAGASEQEIALKVESDRVLGRTLERELGTGARVFQLPVLGFPEVAPPWQLSDYEHFRPFLATDTLRFSYGVPKYRPRGRWQTELEGLEPLALARRLEEYGFAALYFNRRAYEDGGEQLLETLRAAGYTREWAGAHGAQVVVALNPAPVPRVPVAHTLTPGRGWQNRRIEGVRWTAEPAMLLYFNPHRERLIARIRLELELPHAQRVSLWSDGRKLVESELPAGRQILFVESAALKQGFNSFRLEGGAAQRVPGGGWRMLGLRTSRVELARD